MRNKILQGDALKVLKDMPQSNSGQYDVRMGAKQKIKETGYTDCGCGAGFEPGIVLDPFFGAGTTGLTALKLGRDFIGIEQNAEYIKIAEKRLSEEMAQEKLAI